MKTNHLLSIAALIVLLLASTLILSAFYQPAEPTAGLNTLALQSKITPLQAGTDQSVVGSTTGIFIMGIVIIFIVTLPMLLRKKK